MNDPLGLFSEDKGSDPLGLFTNEAVIPGGVPVTPSPEPTIGQKALGVGEAGLSILSSIPASAYAGAVGIAEKIRGGDMEEAARKSMEANVYQPRTEAGQDYAKKAGDVFQALFPNMIAMAPKPVITRMPIRGKAAPAVTTPVSQVFEKHSVPTELVPDTKGPLPTINQMELPDAAMAVAPQYGIHEGMGRVDENGMPIRADLSMDAQNVRDPLQLGLWGDELDTPTGDGGLPLTQAIDSMPPGDARAAAIQNLSHDLPADASFSEAVKLANEEGPTIDLPANPTSGDGSPVINVGMARKQRGAVDMDAVYKGLVNLVNRRVQTIYGVGKVVDHKVITSKDNAELERRLEEATRQASNPYIAGQETSMEATRARTEVATKKVLDDWKNAPRTIPIGAYTVEFQDGSVKRVFGSDIQTVFEGPTGLSRTQRGMALFNFGGDKGEPPKSTTKAPRTPEDIAAKTEISSKLKAIGDVLPEWSDINTPEEVLAMAPEIKDIKSTKTGQQVASGINQMTTYHNNPMLRYGRKLFSDARGYANSYSKEFITNRKTGLAPTAAKMSPAEKTQLMEVLMEASKRKVDITPEMINDLNLTENQRQFIDTYKTAMERALDDWNAFRAEQGIKPVTRLPGYFPGIFKGDFKTVVVDKANQNKVLGVITADTAGQFEAAMKHIQDNYPNAHFLKDTAEKARRGISGNQNRKFITKDVNDVIDLLSEVDPKFAEMQAAMDHLVVESARNLFGMNVHELKKKGVFGSEGNKPWMSPERNAKEAMDALIKFMEESAEYRGLQRPITEINKLAKDPKMAHLPNTFDYLDKYMRNAAGQYITKPGQMFNLAFDTASELLEGLPVAGKHIGPGRMLKASAAVKNAMSQYFMGWGNWMFTVSQLVQPAQTGLPMMSLVANRLGMNSAQAVKFMTSGAFNMMRGYMHETGQIKQHGMTPQMEGAYKFARDRGIFDFSELEEAYSGHKGKLARTKDTIAEINMRIGEKATRGPMFLGFADMLMNGGIEPQKAYRIAEHLTAQSMIDYHPWERPLLYGGLGVAGQFAGGLTTFKHGYLGQQAVLAKEIKRTGNPIPLATSTAAMIALAGLTGIPFYNEMDWLFQQITDKMGEKKTISETVLKNQDAWVKYGLVSDIMELNMQGKFSSANMIPDDLPSALSPHLKGAWDIGAAMIDAAKNQDEQSFAELANQLTPAGWKRATEALTRKDEKGNLLDKNRQVRNARSKEDWNKSAITGLTPLKEHDARTSIREGDLKRDADHDAQKKIADEYKRFLRGHTSKELKTPEVQAIGEEIIKRYTARKGNSTDLTNNAEDVKEDQRLTEKQRKEGVLDLDDLSSIYRYKYYNK